MISSLDTLSTFGSELTAEQLDDVDGGAFWAGAAAALFVVYLIEKYG